MRIIIFILAVLLTYNTSAFNLNSLFPSMHRHKKASRDSYDYDSVKQNYDKNCTKQKVAYGVQIQCTGVDEPKNFKFDASAIVKCRQKVHGVTDLYPAQIDLPLDFIKRMKFCSGAKIFGPNIIHTTNISEGELQGIQKNKTETFYDVVCNTDQNYQSSMYKYRQAKYDATISNKLEQCEHITETMGYPSRYILIFKILGGLAVFSFALRFYFKYKKR